MTANSKSKKVNKKSGNALARVGNLQNVVTFDEFVLWVATPLREKYEMGLITQRDFARYHGIHETRLSEWKKNPAYYPRLTEIRNAWAKDRTSDVIDALYRGAIGADRNSPQDRKLWLQYVEGFKEDKGDEEDNTRPKLATDDLRFLIGVLPEPQRTEAYEHFEAIRDLLALSPSVREFVDRGDGTYVEPTTVEDSIPREAYNDAPSLSWKHRNEMASGDSRSIRSDMVSEIEPNYYQSTERWWEE